MNQDAVIDSLRVRFAEAVERTLSERWPGIRVSWIEGGIRATVEMAAMLPVGDALLASDPDLDLAAAHLVGNALSATLRDAASR